MIPERFMVKGEAKDGSGHIEGLLCISDEKYYIVYDNDFYIDVVCGIPELCTGRFKEVFSSTIESVKVRVNEFKDDYCPNCGDNLDIHRNYCNDCGQRLEWE